VTVTGSLASRTVHPIAPPRARFVRITVDTPTNVGHGPARIYEVEVYAAALSG
jgi:hypothetical protein